MDVQIEEARKLKRASACIRTGGVIQVKLPHHWPKTLKQSVTQELVERLCQKDSREKALLKKAAHQTRITIQTHQELTAFVERINAETFQVPLGKVQIGNARYNHLAQLNLRTKTMTVSKYCLTDAPADALRYLIIHELTHYFEAGHGPRFWKRVEAHVPDYKLQSRIMKAFHHQAVIHDGASEEATAMESSNREATPLPVLPLEVNPTPQTPRKRYASKRKQEIPVTTTLPISSPQTIPAINTEGIQQRAKTPFRKKGGNNKAGGLIPGFIKQLLLWIDA